MKMKKIVGGGIQNLSMEIRHCYYRQKVAIVHYAEASFSLVSCF